MSKKRTSSDSSKDEPSKEVSDSAFQQEDNAKRGNLVTSSDTTLQDLPIDLLERILVDVVTTEVIGMHLVRSVWKAKANLAINRLCGVCSSWKNILTSDFFREEVNRVLDDTTQQKIRLEIVHQSTPKLTASSVAAMKDEIFLLYNHNPGTYAINVYDRNNMTQVKDIIPLTSAYTPTMVACTMDDSLVVLTRQLRFSYALLRIIKDAQQRFTVAPIIIARDIAVAVPCLSITSDGAPILAHQDTTRTVTCLSIYERNGSLRSNVILNAGHLSRGATELFAAGNGNIIVASVSNTAENVVTEFDQNGVVIHQRNSAIGPISYVCKINEFGHLLIASGINKAELIDSEFNLLEVIKPKKGKKERTLLVNLAYNSERNEVVSVVNNEAAAYGSLVIFHLIDG